MQQFILLWVEFNSEEEHYSRLHIWLLGTVDTGLLIAEMGNLTELVPIRIDHTELDGLMPQDSFIELLLQRGMPL